MSDKTVDVEFGDDASDKATLLLAAAQELGLDPSVVTVTSSGSNGLTFSAPEEVHEKAFGEEKKPAKKAAAKKAAASDSAK